MWFVDLFSKLFSGQQMSEVKTEISKAIIVPSPAVDGSGATVVEVKPKPEEPKPMLDLTKVTYKESPNKSDRKDVVRAIVLHHTGPGSFNGIVNWLCGPTAKAAAHYVLGINGELTQLVNTSRNAWHAGASKFLLDGQVRDNLNHCTIGIEICNAGVLHKGEDGKFYYEAGRDMKEWKGATPIEGIITYPSGKTLTGYFPPYPQVQIDKLVELCKALVAKYPNIGKEDILTHYGIATPEGRKNDPFGLNVQDIISKIFGG